ncbi:AraC family ligand binding domain-containing protein [Streptomyces gardneri]|uniref:AraC family ligand binding domain-containing protein n=1 Tax=Streptomyces gardneri TaxID=66892 RepID=UPI0006E36DC3|nr:AraC family ligand binding domain-containing protein [Streptomyces gardneri]QPK43584.1 AraC family ligand binding domain-containing protein [Streptomyces gardneri]WRK34828.1 AraC family ligand binding domain-containing protein [Streptomyces venezuelae]
MTIERPTGLSAGFHAHLRQAGVPGLVHAGDQHAPTSWVIGSHTHDVWELYLQLAGPSTRWAMADRTWHVPARGLLMVPPGVPHAMAESSTAPYHFHFAALAPADIVPPDHLHPLWGQRRPFVFTDAGSMVAPFALFLREVATHQPLRTAGLACAAALLVIEASRLADRDTCPVPHPPAHGTRPAAARRDRPGDHRDRHGPRLLVVPAFRHGLPP